MVGWISKEECLQVRVIDESPFKSVKALRSATAVANRTQVSKPIRQVLEASLMKLNAKAYLHWYSKFGVEKEDFLKCFDSVSDIVEAYETALQ